MTPDTNLSTKTPPLTSPPLPSTADTGSAQFLPDGTVNGMPTDVLTIVLDFKDPGQPNTSDIFGFGTSTFDVTSFGFAATDFDLVANSILAEVNQDYFTELMGTVAGPVGQDLEIDFIIGDIGTPPPGISEYYFVQIGTGVGAPAGVLGVAGGSVIRNVGGTGPNFGIQVGDVVGSIFTDAIGGLGNLTPANALTSGNLAFTTFAVSGTISHEMGHTVSLSHVNDVGSIQPTAGAPPIMGTGAIDLVNQRRIEDREFSLSGLDGENGNAPIQHVQQLVDAIGLHDTIPNDGEQIRGVKFNDRDGNGLRGTNEEGLEGWTIYLDVNNNGRLDRNEVSTVTSANGSYELEASVGTHIVREVARPFWTQTAPGGNGSQTVVITDVNEDAFAIDFGNIGDVTEIHGVEWLDENQNGVRDAGEPGLPGVVINAVAEFDGLVRSTVTGPFGEYAFLSLPPDAYTVTDTLSTGYLKTFPTTLLNDHSVLLRPGQKLVDIDFGNFAERGTISGIKFEDRNGDGFQDLDEFGIGGIRIYVDTNLDGRLSVGEPSAITNSDGTYQILAIPPGTYTVREVAVAGQEQTFPENVGAQTVVVLPGQDTPSVNFGNRDYFDFGDAPANFPTLAANQGARHAIISGFYLGQSVDSETDGQPSLLADGDDNGSGGFAAAVAINVGAAPAGGAAGDLNGDGFADLAIADEADNTVSVLLNNGDGTYAQRVANLVGTGPVDVAMGDFDGDGDTDLAVANLGSSNVSILLNRGDGTFEDAVSFGSGSRPSSIVAANLNGGADIDLVVANSGTETVSVMLGIGDGAFESPQPYDINEGRVTDVALADFDQNGTIDVVATSPDSDRVSILLNDGTGVLGAARDFIVGDGPSSVFAGDLTQDGVPDIAVANQLSGDVSVLRNRGTGSFFPAATYAVGFAPTSIVGADLTGDGNTDLAIANGFLGEFPVLINAGGGVFGAPSAFTTGVTTNALLAADLNGDNAADLVAINTSQNNISLILSNGDDEDGIVLSGDLRTGESAAATVTASQAGVLNAWIDFNRNGVWEAGEQISRNASVPAGDSTVFFTIPNGASLGASYARFRFSMEENIGPSGDAPSGEVEDYQVTIVAGGNPADPRSVYTNPINRFDVDGNGNIELSDVLVVINALRDGSRVLPNPPPPGTPLPPFIDVSGDGNLTLNDVLLVVNALFAQMNGTPLPPPGPRPPAAEGESLDSLAIGAAVSDPDVSQVRVADSTESLVAAAAIDSSQPLNLQSSRSAPGAWQTVPIYGASARKSNRGSWLETSLDEIALDVHSANGNGGESG